VALASGELHANYLHFAASRITTRALYHSIFTGETLFPLPADVSDH